MPPKKIARKQKQQERIRIGSRVSIFINTEKSPFWQLQYQLNGKSIRESLKVTSLKRARTLAAQKDLELEAGVVEEPVRVRTTVAKVTKLRRERRIQQGRDPKTIRQYDLHDRRLMAFLPKGGDTPVSQLSVKVLEEFEMALSSKGVVATPKPGSRHTRKIKPLARKTVRDTMKSVRGFIDFAFRRGLITHDPSAAYDLPFAPDADITVLSSTQLKELYTDLDTGHIREFFVHTCLRANEFTWLTRDDVVFDDNGHPKCIQIRAKTCQDSGEQWKPKHGKARLVPLTDRAAEILAKALATSNSQGAFESPYSKGKQTGKWTYSPLLRCLHLRLEEIGSMKRGLHALRHTGATWYANDGGMPIAQLQKFLGHQRLAETQRYLHPSTEDIAASLARVDFSKQTPASKKD